MTIMSCPKKTLLVPKNRLCTQCLHRLGNYLNLEFFLEKSLEIKSALKSTGNHSKAVKRP